MPLVADADSLATAEHMHSNNNKTQLLGLLLEALAVTEQLSR